MIHKLVFDTTDADTRAASAQVGAVLYDAVNDRLGVINASQELLVHDADVLSELQGGISVDDGGGSLTVDAVNLDIRDLSHTQDSVQIGDGTDLLAVNADGSINVHLTDATGITIDESDVYAEDSAHTTGDNGSFILAVRNDTPGSLVDTNGDYAPLQVDSSGNLRVSGSIAINSEYAEDSAHSSGDIGQFNLTVRQDVLAASTDADGDYAAFKSNSVGELYTTDEGAEALLTTIDASLDAIEVDVAAIETELLDQGTTLDGIKTDTAAMVVDLAAIEVELLDQGTTLDGIKTDTAALVVDLAAIEVELLDQGTTLDSILSDTASIDSTLTALSKAEDSAHVSGDQGFQALAVRQDTLASSVDADGDYASLKVDSVGQLYVTSSDDNELANTAIASAANPLTAANVAEDVVVSPLSNRKYLFVYNNGNKTAYVGATGVTASTGFPLPPGSLLEMRAGAAIDIEWVAADTGQELRTLELA